MVPVFQVSCSKQPKLARIVRNSNTTSLIMSQPAVFKALTCIEKDRYFFHKVPLPRVDCAIGLR